MADGLALPQLTPSVPWAGALQGGTGGGRWATPCLPADGGDLGPPPESLGDSETPDPQPPAQLSPEEGQAIGGAWNLGFSGASLPPRSALAPLSEYPRRPSFEVMKPHPS